VKGGWTAELINTSIEKTVPAYLISQEKKKRGQVDFGLEGEDTAAGRLLLRRSSGVKKEAYPIPFSPKCKKRKGKKKNKTAKSTGKEKKKRIQLRSSYLLRVISLNHKKKEDDTYYILMFFILCL